MKCISRSVCTGFIKLLHIASFTGNGSEVASAGAPQGPTSNCIFTCRPGSRGLRHHRITCHRLHWRELISHLYSCFFHFSAARAGVVCSAPLKRAFILVRETRLGLPRRPKTIGLEIDYTVALNTQFNCVERHILSSRLSRHPPAYK